MTNKLLVDFEKDIEDCMGVKLRKRKLPSGKTQLYLDIYRFGSRRTEALGFSLDGDRFQNRETMRMAEEVRAKRELALQAEMHGLSGTHNRRASFIEFLEAEAEKRVAENTRLSWDAAIEQLRAFAGDSVVFGDLSSVFFERFKDYLLGKIAPSSAQMYFGRIKSGVIKAMKEGKLPNNPVSGITIKKSESLPVFLTLQEVEKLAQTACPNATVKAAFLFSCFSGVRYSDVCRLTWENVRGDNIQFSQRKTGGEELLPLSRQARDILAKQRNHVRSDRVKGEAEDGVVFPLPRQSTVDKDLKRWAKRAGINKSVSFHKARHTFATLSLSAGVDIYTTSKLLGHKNLQTTQIYARVVDERKRQAVEMLPVIDV